jgi:hypothetical protein
MAEDVFNENDDDDLVVVETEDEKIPVGEDEAPTAEEPEEQSDEDEEDEERMGVSDEDTEQEVTKRQTRDRRTRRQIQKQAKERSQRELEFLRQQNAELMQRMSAIEGNTLSQQAQTIAQQYQQALYEKQQAELIIAKAVEAGNGDDVTQAMRIRDEANYRAAQLAQAQQQAEQYAQQATQPRTDPRVVDYAKQWLDANPWYNPQGRDEDSAITKAIDNALAAEGWNPASEDYWHELTRRVAARIGGDDAPAQREAAPRRKAPPTGNTREHAPVSTRKEVYVTPERKQAMIEAGVWDDPVARKRYLKAYQAYDRDNTAR